MYEFDYLKPDSPAAARAAADDDTRYLAGGQSLIQAMRLRLASATQLIALRDIAELRGISEDAHSVRIGAMSTHAEVAQADAVRRSIPALAELAAGIGDPMVRNMGTIGGSLANADPAACYPAGALGLGATIHTDQREIAADDFFLGLYETALAPGELITAVSFPIPVRAAYVKLKQAASRFALIGVMVSSGPAGIRVAVTGARAAVFRFTAAETALTSEFSVAALQGQTISTDEINGDLHADARYRAAMIPEITRRAVAAALNR